MSELALASFDALRLTEQLASTSDGASEGELHTLAYLSCLLSVFDGRPPVWWGYGFTATRAGTPFALAIRQAVEDAVSAGFLTPEERVLKIGESGRRELRSIAELTLNRRHERYLEAAAATALTMPLPVVSDALSNEPGLRGALRFLRTKALLDETGMTLLESQFEALAQALESPGTDDLLVPSVVWLTYLARQQLPAQDAA